MVKNFTRPGVVFFMIALASFVAVQICWIKSLQEGRIRSFKLRALSALVNTNSKIVNSTSWQSISNAEIASFLHQSFSSEGLKGIHFTFTVGANNLDAVSHPITRFTVTDPVDMTLFYPLSTESNNLMAGSLLTVIIPDWMAFVWKGMLWPFVLCGLLTMMAVAVLFYGWTLNRQREIDSNTEKAEMARQLIQQLENPLSSMAVAVEALSSEKVIDNSSRRQFYHDIIDAENARMNERVSKIFQERNR